jgi:hypothetical protein
VDSIRAVNRFFDGFDEDAARRGRQALVDSESLLEAAERAGLLDRSERHDGGGLREMIEALPPAVATSLHGALRSAAERDLPVVLQWKPAAFVELQVWEAVEGGVGQVGVLLDAVRPRGALKLPPRRRRRPVSGSAAPPGGGRR